MELVNLVFAFALVFFIMFGVIHLWDAWGKVQQSIMGLHFTEPVCECNDPTDSTVSRNKDLCQPQREVL